MIVDSCFDGSSCVQQAFKTLGITFDGIRNEYYASEIDPYAQAVTKYNFPNTIFLGDVRDLDIYDFASKVDVDLMVAGSPCQDLSFAGKGLGFSAEGKRSNLFWVWLQRFKAVKPRYVLVENVRMKKQWQDMMSEGLGFEPQEINSKLQSAQNRVRLYWFGKRVGDKYVQVPIQDIKDLGIVLGDIVENGQVDRDKSYCLDANYWKGGNLKSYFEKRRRQLVFDSCIQVGETADIKGYDIIKRVYSTKGKAPTLTTMQGGHREPKIATSDKTWRKLTPLECERLQTLPDGYTQYGDFGGEQFDKDGNFVRYTTKPISNTQRYKMIGNGMTVSIIARILEGMDI